MRYKIVRRNDLTPITAKEAVLDCRERYGNGDDSCEWAINVDENNCEFVLASARVLIMSDDKVYYPSSSLYAAINDNWIPVTTVPHDMMYVFVCTKFLFEGNAIYMSHKHAMQRASKQGFYSIVGTKYIYIPHVLYWMPRVDLPL